MLGLAVGVRFVKMKTTVVALTGLLGASALVACSPRTEIGGASNSDATTLHRYIVDNNIPEVSFKAGEPGTPDVSFAMPPGWRSAGDATPDWAYGAIVYDKAMNPEDPPYMVAIASKLPADLDPETVLAHAPAQLNNLPGFEPFNDPRRDSISGFEAVDYTGTYLRQGQPRVIGQQTIVVPGTEALFVFQLNADAPAGEDEQVRDAAKIIDEKTTIRVAS